MSNDGVYERILARVEREELGVQCCEVALRDGKLIDRRIRGARRALQHVLDVDAATKLLPVSAASSTTMSLLDDIKRLQQSIDAKIRLLDSNVSHGGTVVASSAHETPTEVKNIELKTEPLPTTPIDVFESTIELPTVTQRKRLKRRISHESIDSPRKPPRPGRLLLADEDNESAGPHATTQSDDDETEDEQPVDLDVLNSDAETDVAAYLEKARRLRKLSSDRRMSELPGLIQGVLELIDSHEWMSMPRDLLGALSATFGAATTLKPHQREELRDELNALKATAFKIDDATARRYPTLTGTKARFLSSLSGFEVETPRADVIEVLCAATAELAKSTNHAAMEDEIGAILQLVEHVFDNPSVARTDRYKNGVARSLEILINYVQAIPRRTRRTMQCEEMLRERLESLHA